MIKAIVKAILMEATQQLKKNSEVTIKKIALTNAMENGGLPVNNIKIELNEWIDKIVKRATEIENGFVHPLVKNRAITIG